MPPKARNGSSSKATASSPKKKSSASSSSSAPKKTSTLSLNKPGTAPTKKPLKSITDFHKPISNLTKAQTPNSSSSSGSSVIEIEAVGKSKGKAKAKEPDPIVEVYDQLWVDQFVPQDETDLAVHKRKVEDVRRWLVDALESPKLRKYRRVLALTGPAGVGKTATLRVLAKELNVEILEWRNGMDDVVDSDYESLSAKFQNFLDRASSYRTLSFASTSISSSTLRTAPTETQRRRQLILVEDLPNVLHHATREAFHSALLSFANSPEPPACPIVFVISNTGVRGDAKDERSGGRRNEADDGVDVRKVIPPTLFNSPYFIELQFNPIAITYLRRAVNSLLDKVFSSSGPSSPAQRPPKDVVEMVLDSAHGDIRSAVMALQFACVVDLPTAKGKGKLKGKGAKGVLEAITHHEQSLALFHIVGKLLYNKRYGDPEEKEEAPYAVPQLPKHLRQEHRRRLSKVDSNVLYADSPVETSLLSLYVHQNYTQYCDTIDQCDALMENMSIVDIIGQGSTEGWTPEANQLLPHAFHTLTIGTLHSLPSPVPRRGQKNYKSAFFDVLGKSKEGDGAVADAQGWLGPHWRTKEVILETGCVLNAMSSVNGMDPTFPRSFGKFGCLSFVKGGGNRSAGPVDEGDVGEDGPDAAEEADEEILEARARALSKAGEKEARGWLSDDEIVDE